MASAEGKVQTVVDAFGQMVGSYATRELRPLTREGLAYLRVHNPHLYYDLWAVYNAPAKAVSEGFDAVARVTAAALQSTISKLPFSAVLEEATEQVLGDFPNTLREIMIEPASKIDKPEGHVDLLTVEHGKKLVEDIDAFFKRIFTEKLEGMRERLALWLPFKGRTHERFMRTLCGVGHENAQSFLDTWRGFTPDERRRFKGVLLYLDQPEEMTMWLGLDEAHRKQYFELGVQVHGIELLDAKTRADMKNILRWVNDQANRGLYEAHMALEDLHIRLSVSNEEMRRRQDDPVTGTFSPVNLVRHPWLRHALPANHPVRQAQYMARRDRIIYFWVIVGVLLVGAGVFTAAAHFVQKLLGH